MFASDWYVTLNSSSGNSSQVVAINFYNNRDLVINSVSYLTDREDNITIRKIQELQHIQQQYNKIKLLEQ